MKRKDQPADQATEQQKVNQRLELFKNAIGKPFSIFIHLKEGDVFARHEKRAKYTRRPGQIELTADQVELIVKVNVHDSIVSVDEQNELVIGECVTAPVMWCCIEKPKTVIVNGVRTKQPTLF